jgi:hypothetical protein
MAVLAAHYYQIFALQEFAGREADLPFTYTGEVAAVKPEAERGGIKVGDRIESINGRKLDSDSVYTEELVKLKSGQAVSLAMARKLADGQITRYETSVMPVKIERDFSFYSQFIVGFIFSYVLPAFSILLGFWVVFVRPQDFLAWILLFVLLGLSLLSLEMYADNTIGRRRGRRNAAFDAG